MSTAVESVLTSTLLAVHAPGTIDPVWRSTSWKRVADGLRSGVWRRLLEGREGRGVGQTCPDTYIRAHVDTDAPRLC